MRSLPWLGRATAFLLLTAAGAARAESQPLALADDPFEITDPLVAKPGEAELNVVGVYDRASSGAYRGTGAFDTELQLGVAPRLEIRIGQMGAYGNLDLRGRPATLEAMGSSTSNGVPAGGGATRLGALYQVTDGTGALPVVAILGRVRSLYGRDRPGYEGDLFGLFGYALGPENRQVGLNLNIGWTTRFHPIRGERPGLYSISATIGQSLSRDTVAVVGYVRRQQERGARDFSLVEIGMRQRLSEDLPVLGLAAGFGTNRDSPRWRVTMAAQWSFGGD